MPEEETAETTEQNPAEEETAEETQEETQEEPEQPQEEKETPKEQTKETYTERERRLYARLKESEEVTKKTKDELGEVREELAKAKIPISDVDAILEVQTATSGLDPDEVAELKFRASILGDKLSDARKDKNFLLWQKAHREEVDRLNAAKPTTVQAEEEKPKTIFDQARELGGRTVDKDGTTVVADNSIKRDVAKLAEKEKLLEEHGLWVHPRKAQREERFKIGP
jgi:hypothetical protein